MPTLIMRTSLAVNEGALDHFLAIADRWVQATADEPGTLGFHCFVDREAHRAVFLEHYQDSDAFMTHRAAVPADLRTELYTTCSVDAFEVYGDLDGPAADTLKSVPTYSHHRSK